ncbi:MAG: glycosyltransferase family 4 protein [Gemmatimonadaceae bacterium]|nr:glycosyltransferase family 4 protein [Gemmatimonadaceae bacterium]
MTAPAGGVQRPRILVVSFIGTPGGAHNLWRHLVLDPAVAARFEFHLLAPAGYREADPAPFATGGVTFHPMTELLPPPFRDRLLRRMVGREVPETTRWRTRLDAIAPDLVLFNLAGMGDMNWGVPAGEAAAARRTPYWLVLQHAHEDYHFVDDARTDAALALARGARRVLTVSRRNQRTLERALGAVLANAEPAVNGVTPATLAAGARTMRAHPPQVKGTVRMLCLARFDPAYKGQDLLLEVLAAPDWRDRDWVLTLQGGGTHPRLLERYARAHGFGPERVILAPHAADVSAAFAAADLLVFPSRSEGSPFALVEGMAHGRPAVVTPVGGNDELVVEGRTGWVASAVTVEAFRAALSRAWVARAAWPAAGHAAHEHVAAGWTLDAPHRALAAKLAADCGR